MHLITIRDQVCNVMASLTKTFFVSPEIVLQSQKSAPHPGLLSNSGSHPGRRCHRCGPAGSSGSSVAGSHPGIVHPNGT